MHSFLFKLLLFHLQWFTVLFYNRVEQCHRYKAHVMEFSTARPKWISTGQRFSFMEVIGEPVTCISQVLQTQEVKLWIVDFPQKETENVHHYVIIYAIWGPNMLCLTFPYKNSRDPSLEDWTCDLHHKWVGVLTILCIVVVFSYRLQCSYKSWLLAISHNHETISRHVYDLSSVVIHMSNYRRCMLSSLLPTDLQRCFESLLELTTINI